MFRFDVEEEKPFINVADISRVKGVGVQVVVRCHPIGKVTIAKGRIESETTIWTSESPEWPRLKAAAKVIERDHNVGGELVEVRQWCNERMFSWKETA